MVLDRVIGDMSVVEPVFMELPVAIELPVNNEIEPSREIWLPTEAELPLEYQNKSKELVSLMEVGKNEINVLEPKVDEFERVVNDNRKDFESIIAEKPDVEIVEKSVQELKTQILTEVQSLLKIRKQLIEKGDATSLLEISSVRSGELYKFGKPRNPLQWAEQVAWKRQPNYAKGKDDFTDYQWVLFNRRVDELKDTVRTFVGNQESEVKMPSSYGWDINSTEFDKKTQDFGETVRSQSVVYREQHESSSTKKAVLESVRTWLQEDWAKNINLASKWTIEQVGLGEITQTIDYVVGDIDKSEAQVVGWLDSYDHSSHAYKGALLGKALDLGEVVAKNMLVRELAFTEMITSGMEYEDYMWLLPYCGSSMEEYQYLSELDTWTTDFSAKNEMNLGLRHNQFTNVASILRSLSEANKKFPESQDLMWHSASPDVLIDKVIAPGLLLSRAEQMNRYSEADFASANMKVKKLDGDQYELTQDFFPYSTSVKTLTREELIKVYGSGGKQWFEEYNQICFSREYSYFRDNLDIALCFSKTSLISNRQFMLADGWHVFDSEYQGSPDSPGFQINLNEEPHLLVVVKSKSLPLLTEKLTTASQQGKILGGIEDVGKWIQEHVVVIESFVSEEERTKIKQEFHSRFAINKKQGYFMPSGIKAPETPGVHKPQPLVTYKTK